MIAALGHAYAIAGMRTEATKILDDLMAPQQTEHYVPPYSVALIHIALGNKQKAFEWMDRAFQERDESFIHLRVDPRLDDLRSDPQFIDLLRRINLV
jgi:serine/threonine-protein kinase